VAAACDELETGLLLLGATAVEDKFQASLQALLAAWGCLLQVFQGFRVFSGFH